ncbi:hypothetical protein [Pediococcus pentosaceus]|uniref:hypothetical protein n=1 Tax=Pediococcus pentosaceus TaxID=1255 RepID=UPI001E5338D2|nr:hypothetical protein [Pediococcus pentosaceus]MCG7196506.1 hypothetical protein [Pediococcus pentosaceus]MCI2396178.1 hypothetical protein [Pediococcus pentosaceus]
MHMIFGFTISEWAGIATIIGSGTGVFYKFIVMPLLNKFDVLSKTLVELKESSRIEQQSLKDELKEHQTILIEHDSEIQSLFEEKGWPRSNAYRSRYKDEGEI